MGGVDLHIHTTASDGALTPSQVVRLATGLRLEAIAVTDHDTIDGVAEAVNEGERQELEVVTGIEISANSKHGSLHLLGYFVETERGNLKEKLLRLKQARSERNPRIIQKLNDLGLRITYQEVVQRSGGGQVGRPHFAQVLVDKGYVGSIDEAFARYLAQGAPAYVDKYRFEVKEAIEMVLRAGGVPILAHPFTVDLLPADLESLVTELARNGLKGIEAYYPDHTPEQIVHYENLASRLNLIKTGGSDFHGSFMEKSKLGIINSRDEEFHLPYSVVDSLKRVKPVIRPTSSPARSGPGIDRS